MESLRDRIAAALQCADRRLALEDEMPIGLYYARVADAVIAALKPDFTRHYEQGWNDGYEAAHAD